jgi:hypothetical protein
LRRIFAIAKLCFLEAIRGRVLYVFILFFLPLLFAGWYLSGSPEGKLVYLVGFVNTAITFILLPMTIFLVSMSLPNEIQSRVVQTIVTKPVRRLEIVVGRILGFTAVFTLVLAVMGAASIFYVRGQLPEETRDKLWIARAPIFANDTVAPAERVLLDQINSQLPPEQHFKKLPIPQTLMFWRDKQWNFQGTNVGKEWQGYRSHVGGDDSAHWCFSIDPELFARVDDSAVGTAVRAQFEFDIFKTTKGDPSRDVGDKQEESGVNCLVQFIDRSSPSGKTYGKIVRVNHQRVVEVPVPVEYFDGGRVEVAVKCLTKDQFVGMAPSDLYFLARETSFAWNFAKGLVGVWMKMFLIICVAVAASTALKGFVTVLFTGTVYVLGLYLGFMSDVARGLVKGGGPLESTIRLVTQANQVSALDPDNGLYNLLINIDKGLLWFMSVLVNLIPSLSNVDLTYLVAAGIEVPATILLVNIVQTFAYAAPVAVIGYFLLRNRELAA